MRVTRVNPRTVLFITHSVEEAVFLADRVIVLSRGPGSMAEIIPVSVLFARTRNGSARRARR